MLITKSRMGFYNVLMQVGNMRKPQEFTLYPEPTDFGEVWLQSDKRFIAINLNNGNAIINAKNKDYARRTDLINGITFQVSDDLIEQLKSHYSKHKAGGNEVKSGDTVVLTY